MKSSRQQLNSSSPSLVLLRSNSVSAFKQRSTLPSDNNICWSREQSNSSRVSHLNGSNKSISNQPNKIQKSILFIMCGLYLQLVSKMLGGTQLVSGQTIKCGDMKQCSAMFRQATLQHNLSYDLSKERIEEMCIKLNKAVECFNEFRRSCINEHLHHSKVTANFYDQMSEGPLGLTMELCNNEKFKHDYLTLGPCQKKYRGEFDRCLRLPQVTSSSNSNTNTNGKNSHSNDNGHGNGLGPQNETILERFIEHCCTLHSYHNCIYDISLDKCGKDAAEFSLKILELFNRAYLRDCAKHANLSHLCVRNHYLASSASSAVSSVGRTGCLSILLISFVLTVVVWIFGNISSGNLTSCCVIGSSNSSHRFPLLFLVFAPVLVFPQASLTLPYLLCASLYVGNSQLST